MGGAPVLRRAGSIAELVVDFDSQQLPVGILLRPPYLCRREVRNAVGW